MIQQQNITLAALSTTSETLLLPQGARAVRVRAPAMSVATNFEILGSVDEVTYDTLYIVNTKPTYTVGATPRSIQIDQDLTVGLKRIQIKTNGAETTDKTFTVVYEW